MIGLSHLIITQIPFQDKEFDFKKMSFLAAQHMTRLVGDGELSQKAPTFRFSCGRF